MAENVKLTLNPTPPPGFAPPGQPHPAGSAAAPAETLVDALGRTLTVRELSVLDELDLVALAGDPLCLNRLYMSRLLDASSVAAIDGDPLPIPRTMGEFRVSLKRLGREGMEAIVEHCVAKREQREKERATVAKK